MRRITAILVVCLALAGCSGSSGNKADPTGEFSLQVTDSLAGGKIGLSGAFLRGTGGWVQAIDNGTALSFKGSGGNVSAGGDVPAGDYDRLRLTFSSVESAGRKAILTQSGIELAVNVTVAKDGNTTLGLAFAWADSFFESAQGLAFTPILSRVVVTVDGVETLRLEADEISTGSGKAPVARMRIFDVTGLEAFASTFVADSPENPVVANAGNLTFTASQSEALQQGTNIAKYSWEVGNATLAGTTVKWVSPVNGGNFTVRLTVEDSAGSKDAQTVSLALKPGVASKALNFTGTATGYGDDSAVDHTFDVDNATYNGQPAQLTHIRVSLQPGSAAVALSDLNLVLLDGAGEEVAAETGTGSQHTIDEDVAGPAGTWTVRVTPSPAVDAAYKVTVVLTWKGVNPGMEAFLSTYEDGHTHEH